MRRETYKLWSLQSHHIECLFRFNYLGFWQRFFSCMNLLYICHDVVVNLRTRPLVWSWMSHFASCVESKTMYSLQTHPPFCGRTTLRGWLSINYFVCVLRTTFHSYRKPMKGRRKRIALRCHVGSRAESYSVTNRFKAYTNSFNAQPVWRNGRA